MGRISEATRGVYIISPTPFTDAGELDLDGADRLVDFFLDKGVDGITILGVLGEAAKLTSDESDAFMRKVLKRVDGKKQVVVGASNPGTDNLVRFAKTAMDAGAAGLMIAPIQGLKHDEQIFGYWAEVLGRLGPDIPVCYQDYPQTTGVFTSVAVLNRLIDAFPEPRDAEARGVARPAEDHGAARAPRPTASGGGSRSWSAMAACICRRN